MRNPKQILVVIPNQEWDSSKYSDNCNCYLAEALQDKGFKHVHVLANGHTRIGRTFYRPTRLFDAGTVQAALKKGQDIPVILKKDE